MFPLSYFATNRSSVMICNSSYLGDGDMRSTVQSPPQAKDRENLSLPQGWWQTPVIPAIQEAKVT
jgi:hypothetical protein